MTYQSVNEEADLKQLFEKMEKRAIEAIDSDDKELVQNAYRVAKEAHKEQQRKSGEPYFNHVYSAGMNTAELGMGATTVAAALLHDTIEDTPITEEEIKEKFGDEIVFLVNGVTKLGQLKYKGQERHIESLRKFFMAVAEDPRVVIIKLADRLHNLQTLEHLPEEKQKRIALESIEIYAPLAGRLGMAKLAGQIQDTAFPFAYPEEYKMVTDLLKRRKKSDQHYLEKVYRSLVKEMAKYGIKNIQTHYRVKGKFSLFKKLKRKNMNIDEIHDIIALRVIVPNIEDCYRVLGLIHTMWKPLPGRIKDYIALPKPNSYQSLHTTIFTGDGGIAEIQIRTPEMHDVAEYGIASHFSYKQGLGNKKHTKKIEKLSWVKDFKQVQELEKKPDKFLKQLTYDFFSDRIFVFTPMGDVIDLPKGSTVVDFAYAVHSDIGNHLSGAWINDRYVAIKTELKSGDIVKVEHSKDSYPKSKWVDYAKTSIAQKHIKSYLKKNSLISKWFYGSE